MLLRDSHVLGSQSTHQSSIAEYTRLRMVTETDASASNGPIPEYKPLCDIALKRTARLGLRRLLNAHVVTSLANEFVRAR